MVLICHFWDPAEGFVGANNPLIGAALAKVAYFCMYGVELFFVLSGFLITGILIETLPSANYFSAFYVRRLLRIFPLYYVALLAIFILLPRLWRFDAAAEDMASRQVWLWTYLSNAPWSIGWSGWNDSRIFRVGHFWSLCVEEHFYLIWPFVVYLASRRNLAKLCVVGILAGFAFRVWNTTPGGPILLGWPTLTKLDGLFAGSLVAIACRNPTLARKISNINLRAGIWSALICFGLWMIPRRWSEAWRPAIIELPVVILSTSILVSSLRQNAKGIVSSFLHNSFLRAFGKYSYGIYVIHYIMYPAFDKMFQHENLLKNLGYPLIGQATFYALTISSSYLLAFASWHLLEKHFLSLKRHFEYRLPTGTMSA